MATKARRPCRKAGCKGLYDPETDTCSRCGTTGQQKTGWQHTGTRQQRGYGADWQKVRDRKLAVDPFCAECKRKGRDVVATQVHHIKPFRGLNDPLRLAWDNLESVCEACHVRASARESNKGE